MDLLHNGGFMRLFATRMTGSLGDGVLQAALAAFVVFSPERQATPLAIATSFGILLLPYSFIGPFAGVFLDRWRRRQVLVYANWLRALTTVITIVIVSRPWATPAIGNASCPGSWPTSPTAADAIPES